MPLINVKVIENVFTPEQKREIAEKLTETMVEIEGENLRGVTNVIIDEVASGDWCHGGRVVTAEDVREMQRGAKA